MSASAMGLHAILHIIQKYKLQVWTEALFTAVLSDQDLWSKAPAWNINLIIISELFNLSKSYCYQLILIKQDQIIVMFLGS
jgi:hypothetical protein